MLQHVSFGPVVSGMDRQEAEDRACRWIARLGLQEFEDAYPATLSGSMQQRVGVARALAFEPEILVMGEPFGSLDALLRDVLTEELLDLHDDLRCTVVFITHSLEEALVLSDRVIVLSARPGRILADRTIPFARPRRLDVRTTPQFSLLRQELWNILRTQVDTGGRASDDDRVAG